MFVMSSLPSTPWTKPGKFSTSEAGAGGVDGGGQAGATGAEDKDVFSHGYVPS